MAATKSSAVEYVELIMATSFFRSEGSEPRRSVPPAPDFGGGICHNLEKKLAAEFSRTSGPPWATAQACPLTVKSRRRSKRHQAMLELTLMGIPSPIWSRETDPEEAPHIGPTPVTSGFFPRVHHGVRRAQREGPL
jgi:hypothetical protein